MFFQSAYFLILIFLHIGLIFISAIFFEIFKTNYTALMRYEIPTKYGTRWPIRRHIVATCHATVWLRAIF